MQPKYGVIFTTYTYTYMILRIWRVNPYTRSRSLFYDVEPSRTKPWFKPFFVKLPCNAGKVVNVLSRKDFCSKAP